MGTVSVVVPPAHAALVTLAEFQAEIGDTDNDAVMQILLDDAQARVQGVLGRSHLARGQYLEISKGSWKTELALSVRPIASLDAVTYLDASQSLDDFYVSRDTGLLYRKTGSFGSEYDPTAWGFTTTAGYFGPEDNLTGSISTDATDSSYNSTALFPLHLNPGDVFVASGWTGADIGNNGQRKVVTATQSKITTNSPLTTAVAASRTLTFHNPTIDTALGLIRRAIFTYASDAYFSRSQASGAAGIIEKSVEGVSKIRWDSASSSSSESGSVASDRSVRSILGPLLDY